MKADLLPHPRLFEVNPTQEEKEALEAWKDPFPSPIIEVIDGIHVVRDDLLGCGSKSRGLDFYIGHNPTTKHIEEWVYGSSPAHGYAQISLSHVCKRYDKTAVLFMAARDPSKYHQSQLRGIAEGGTYHWVPNGMLNVTERRAKDYVAEAPDRRALIPIGGAVPVIEHALAKTAKTIPIQPTHVWTVASSGTLSRSLQRVWPQAEFFVVQVGRKVLQSDVGSATIVECSVPFAKPCAAPLRPPFPSVLEYDAKCWAFLKAWHKDNQNTTTIFWNVGA